MTATEAQLPPLMTVADFLDWPGDDTGTRYELVDGVLRAMAPASDTHGTIQSNLIKLIANHLDVARPGCRVVTTPGVQPRMRADWNVRIPDLGVTCDTNRRGDVMIPGPILLVEVLSPGNVQDTWSNVPLYASLPSVQDVLIVQSTRVGAELLVRGTDGHWPENPRPFAAGATIPLASIGFELVLAEAYRTTHLAGDA